MNRRNIRLMQALAKAGHMGRAAEMLGMAQPHLSTALRNLEGETGVKLFERRPRVKLTPQGQIVLAAAERGFADIDRALDQARLVEQGASGAVCVGFASSVILTSLANDIAAFRRKHLDVRVDLVDMQSSLQWEALATGRLDVALTRQIQAAADVTAMPILHESFVLALPRTHSLARRRNVAASDLAAEDFILFPEVVAPLLHAQIVSICLSAGFTPRVVQLAYEWQTILAFVAQGVGITIAPACAAALVLDAIEFKRLDTQARASVFLCHEQKMNSPAAIAFVGHMLAGARRRTAIE